MRKKKSVPVAAKQLISLDKRATIFPHVLKHFLIQKLEAERKRASNTNASGLWSVGRDIQHSEKKFDYGNQLYTQIMSMSNGKNDKNADASYRKNRSEAVKSEVLDCLNNLVGENGQPCQLESELKKMMENARDEVRAIVIPSIEDFINKALEATGDDSPKGESVKVFEDDVVKVEDFKDGAIEVDAPREKAMQVEVAGAGVSNAENTKKEGSTNNDSSSSDDKIKQTPKSVSTSSSAATGGLFPVCTPGNGKRNNKGKGAASTPTSLAS